MGCEVLNSYEEYQKGKNADRAVLELLWRDQMVFLIGEGQTFRPSDHDCTRPEADDSWAGRSLSAPSETPERIAAVLPPWPDKNSRQRDIP